MLLTETIMIISMYIGYISYISIYSAPHTHAHTGIHKHKDL